jgi:hypothetical protein
MQACGLQIIQALRAMDLVDRLGYLQFDQDDVFDEQVSRIVSDHDPIVSNDHTMLLRDGDPSFPELVKQSVFIDSLKESGSQRAEYRQDAANDPLGQKVNPVLTGFHLRVLRVLRFHCLCLLPAQPFQTVNASRRPRSPDRLHPGLAQRGPSDQEENGTAKHAEHAKGGGALQVEDNAFDLKARLAEVEQKAEMQACGFQII